MELALMVWTKLNSAHVRADVVHMDNWKRIYGRQYGHLLFRDIGGNHFMRDLYTDFPE